MNRRIPRETTVRRVSGGFLGRNSQRTTTICRLLRAVAVIWIVLSILILLLKGRATVPIPEKEGRFSTLAGNREDSNLESLSRNAKRESVTRITAQPEPR